VTGFRLTPARVVGKAKLSQDKPAELVDRVIAGLDDGPLVAAMRAAHPRTP
jgi:transcriptional regulator